ncbi:hypothetical protein LX36DRAFT_178644 [Colletotrichum falcatum]|nr:hypothetical protein LX36DRAFT_178644 [Colletotrichum falcatum]
MRFRCRAVSASVATCKGRCTMNGSGFRPDWDGEPPSSNEIPIAAGDGLYADEPGAASFSPQNGLTPSPNHQVKVAEPRQLGGSLQAPPKGEARAPGGHTRTKSHALGDGVSPQAHCIGQRWFADPQIRVEIRPCQIIGGGTLPSSAQPD